jgi:hypothetical protein
MCKQMFKDLFDLLVIAAFIAAFALLFGLFFGCASTPSDPFGIFKGMEEELKGEQYKDYKPSKTDTGWIARSDDGNHWDFYVKKEKGRARLASCDYQYMKVYGVEMWKGKYYGMTDSMNFHGPVFATELPNLVGCVKWCDKFTYGDYYI